MVWFKKEHTAPIDLDRITYAEGEEFPFHRGKGGDGCVFEYLGTAPAILLYYSLPTEKEIDMVKNGEINMGFFTYESLLCVIAEMGGNMVECPFNANLYKDHTFLKRIGETRNLNIFLIDSETNILRARRRIEMPADFAKSLWEAVSDQMNTPFDREKHLQLVAAVDRQYSVQELWQCIRYIIHCDAVK